MDSDIEVARIECSDICEPLIAIWRLIQDDPRPLVEGYAEHWRLLRQHGPVHFLDVRRAFNEQQDPILLFFLLRTCRTGHVRFNRRGEFNGSFHAANLGMNPDRVAVLAESWHSRLRSRIVSFIVRDYRQIGTEPGDLLYLDPPYETGSGRYYRGGFDHEALFDWLRCQRGSFVFSLNGFVGDEDRRLDVPSDLFDTYRLIDNGVSPYDRLGGRASRRVRESLYIKLAAAPSS